MFYRYIVKVKKKLSFAFINLIFLLTGWFASQLYNAESSQQLATDIADTPSNSKTDGSYLNALERLLHSYEDELDALKDVNGLLQSKISFYDNQKAITSILPSFRKKIHHMDEAEIKGNIESMIRYKHQLKDVKDYKSFALRFVDLALEEDTVPEDMSDGDYLTDVRISISKTSQYIDASDDEFQMSKHYKLYANIASSPPLKSVMLKWTNLSTGELIKYIPFGTKNEHDIEYVWAKPKAGWEVGTYQVSLHKLNDPMTLIARKLYRIASVIDEGEPPVYNGPTGIWKGSN